jgi:hypothetical protein
MEDNRDKLGDLEWLEVVTWSLRWMMVLKSPPTMHGKGEEMGG